MRFRWLLLLAVSLAPAGAASAQTLPLPVPDQPPEVPFDDLGSPDRSTRLWVSTDYLLWWFKSAPVPQPLVTTGSSNDPALGALGGATTRVAIGAENLDFRPQSGGRLTGGVWLDDAQTIGVEAGGFLLTSATVRRSAAVNGVSPQVISIPFFDVTPPTGLFGGFNQENGFVFGAPPGTVNGNGFAGIAELSVTDQLWGAEINGVANIVNRGGLRVDALAGFRYVSYDEKLQLNTSSPTVTPPTPNEFFVTTDRFDARNDFYGGQLGAKVSWAVGRLTATATGKVALGVMHENLNITGSYATNDVFPAGGGFTTGPTQVFPGGYFALPSNIGEHSRDRFGVVPEVDFGVDYALTEGIHLSLGYTFLYLNRVVRPGEEIDRVINGGQSALYKSPNPTLGLQGGPARPTTLLGDSEFWAQGLNFGLEFRF